MSTVIQPTYDEMLPSDLKTLDGAGDRQLADTYSNALKGAWGWFWIMLASTVFFAGLLGWLSIDAFNRHQQRRRARQKAESVPSDEATVR